MDLRQLRYFVAIAEQGNFHKAAAALNIAQSALSRHMQTLGDELGGPLFERTSGGVATTVLGKAFYPEAKALLEQASLAVQRSRQVAAGEIGRLTIGVNEIAARHPTVIEAIRRSRTTLPEVELAITRFNSPEQVQMLSSGRLDLGVIIDRPAEAAFDWMRLCTDPFEIGMAPDHPLAARAELTPEDLRDEKFVAMRRNRYGPVQDQILAACRGLGLCPEIIQEAASEQMQLALVRGGVGLSFVTRSAALIMPGQLVLRPLRGFSYHLDVDLVWHKDNPARPLRHLLEIFRGLLTAG